MVKKERAGDRAAGMPVSYAYTGSDKPLIGETIGHMFERIAAE